MSVLQLKGEDFEDEVLKCEKTVVVDFYATWCGPCKMMAPIIEAVADEMGEEIKVCKVDTDENLDLAQEYGIMSIPTIMIFKNGEVQKTFIGVTSKSEILEILL